MSSATTVSPAEQGQSEPSRIIAAARRSIASVDAALVSLADRANPILVKETRQALKSRQFVVTFLVVLIACWVVTIGGVALIGPQIYYAASGPDMLVAYFCILAFPLAVVVPFSAFRSIAAEQEDNTYDLLSITTLTARRLVTGKLLSSATQMLVFASAVSPCIAFTFLLRGVDALTVGLILAMAVLGGLGLAMLGLLAGTVITRAKYAQIVIAVALVLGLFGAFILSIVSAYGLIEDGYMMYRSSEFWWVVAGGLVAYLTTFGMLHSAAAAQIAFTSENRSTPLRRWMMAQQGCFIGWLIAFAYAEAPDRSIVWGMFGVSALVGAGYWYAMGTMLTSEWPHLSRRVQRSLPQSTLGRAFLTWMNPGPGAGFMFVVANLSALSILGVAAIGLIPNLAPNLGFDRIGYGIGLAWGYVVAYLGFGRLLINLTRRFAYVPMSGGFLIHVILVCAGVGVPMVLQMLTNQFRVAAGYSLIHFTNPFWTLFELFDRGPLSVEAGILILVLPAIGVAALLLNMRSVAAEVCRQRLALPSRVAEEEELLHPAPAPEPANPWEAEAAERQQRDAVVDPQD